MDERRGEADQDAGREIGRVRLVGAGGEPVDLRRTIASHGLAELPPMVVDDDYRSVAITLRLPRGARTVRVRAAADRADEAVVTAAGARLDRRSADAALAAVRAMLRLDADLATFYALAADDPELAWVTRGAGRWIGGQTVFEDIVKTICTTNCAWSATVRMVGALVAHLGEPAPDAPTDGPFGRAFPAPAVMAGAGEEFYRDVVRAGYRGRYLMQLATDVAEGRLDLEALAVATPTELPDEELLKRLLALPGVGPYAAAHVMMLLGRCSRLVLDSWTRPTYARLVGHERVADAEMVARFARYGPDAGRAFWLFLTRDWVVDDAGPP
jgi:N-glycosylase/DNA lyase